MLWFGGKFKVFFKKKAPAESAPAAANRKRGKSRFSVKTKWVISFQKNWHRFLVGWWVEKYVFNFYFITGSTDSKSPRPSWNHWRFWSQGAPLLFHHGLECHIEDEGWLHSPVGRRRGHLLLWHEVGAVQPRGLGGGQRHPVLGRGHRWHPNVLFIIYFCFAKIQVCFMSFFFNCKVSNYLLRLFRYLFHICFRQSSLDLSIKKKILVKQQNSWPLERF